MAHGLYALSIWSELGISGGTAVIILIALYYIVKWAVKNGMEEAWKEIKKEIKGKDGWL